MNSRVEKILLILIALTPLFGIFEGFRGLGISFPFEMIHVKAIKYFFTYLLFVHCLLRISFLKFKNVHKYLIVLILFTLISLSLSSSLNFCFAGFNWLLPIYVMFFLQDLIDRYFLIKLSKVLFFVLIVNLSIQVFQIFLRPPYQGLNIFGLAARLPGFFAISSISAVFTAFSFFIIKYYSAFSKKKKTFTFIIVLCSVLMSMSSAGTGLLLSILLLPFFLNSKLKGLSFFILIPILLVVSLNLDTITGRQKGHSEMSFSVRKKILLDQINNTELLSQNFGKATNLAVNFKRQLGMKNNAFISDMMYTSFLVNMGWIFFAITIVYLFVVTVKIFYGERTDLKVFVLMCFAVSASQIISEMFPTNYLIAIMGGYYMNHNKGCLNDG